MSTELTISISDELAAQIEQARELQQLVRAKEEQAKTDGQEIDYRNFPEYTQLHNLKSAVGEGLKVSAYAAAGISVV